MFRTAVVVVAFASLARAADPAPPSSPAPSTTPGTAATSTATTSPPPVTPTPDEIKRVTAYYLRGKDVGPVLLDLLLCADVTKNADGKLECTAELGEQAKKGDKVTAFVRFFAPRGAKYEDIKVRFLLNGEVRSTSDMTVSESWTGYANYKTTTVTKAGLWEAQVLRGDVVLAARKVKVDGG